MVVDTFLVLLIVEVKVYIFYVTCLLNFFTIFTFPFQVMSVVLNTRSLKFASFQVWKPAKCYASTGQLITSATQNILRNIWETFWEIFWEIFWETFEKQNILRNILRNIWETRFRNTILMCSFEQQNPSYRRGFN